MKYTRSGKSPHSSGAPFLHERFRIKFLNFTLENPESSGTHFYYVVQCVIAYIFRCDTCTFRQSTWRLRPEIWTWIFQVIKAWTVLSVYTFKLLAFSILMVDTVFQTKRNEMVQMNRPQLVDDSQCCVQYVNWITRNCCSTYNVTSQRRNKLAL